MMYFHSKDLQIFPVCSSFTKLLLIRVDIYVVFLNNSFSFDFHRFMTIIVLSQATIREQQFVSNHE